MDGTVIEAKVSRVVDGDTIRVFLSGSEKDESLRILALDTEESYSAGSKPVTPWGKEAKKRAESFFSPGDTIQLEFPGTESSDICIEKYRGNFGRLLVYVHKDGEDYQEIMIREGFSPYFTKYGNAAFPRLHTKYIAAEREAQTKNIGVWNQLEVNGSEIRNYALLSTWWKLRALIIDQYRLIKGREDNLLNTRLDYKKIVELAHSGTEVIIFTELRSIKRVGSRSAVIGIGSKKQPFSLFLPDIESDEGQELVHIMTLRYLSKGDDYPRRGYAYVTGKLSLYRDKPQIKLSSPDQLTDEMPKQ